MKPFSPALPGTAEELWERTLRAAPQWCPSAQPLLVISPHPDDEVLGAGGLMRSHALAGGEVAVMSVTSGEAAFQDWPELRNIRREELREGLRVLAGGRIKVYDAGIPDGRVHRHRRQLFAALGPLIQCRPLLVAPYEFDGHPDHDAAGAVCGELARLQGLPLVRYLIWTWHHGLPEAFEGCNWGRFPLDGETQRAKTQAIACFASQRRPNGRAPIVPNHVLPYFERPYEAFLL